MTIALVVCIGLVVYSVIGIWFTGKGTAKMARFFAEICHKEEQSSRRCAKWRTYYN